MSKTVVFFGNERLATGVTTQVPTLQALIAAGYKVAAVVSNYQVGQSRTARHLEIEQVAKDHNIPLLLPKKLTELTAQLQGYGAEAGILVAYGKIVPESIIDLFPKGIINIHPSLLPHHRGPTPIESALLQGDQKTGVSLMSLAKAMDAGPVYAQSEVDLEGNEDKQALADKLLDIGTSMLIELLPEILNGRVVALPQEESHATYDGLLAKDQGILDWHKSATQLEREIRTFQGWPKSRTTIADKDVVILSARTQETTQGNPGDMWITPEKELAVQTGDGTLIIQSLKPSGRQQMTPQAFLAGHKLT